MKRLVVGVMLVVATCSVRADKVIDVARSLVREDGPVFTGRCEDVRELKYPGQRYVHNIVMTIEGTGQAVTPRCWGWFKQRNTMYLRHVSHAMMIESIESTEKDLEEGIIKSRYEVMRLDEQLEGAKVKVAVGSFDSAEVGKWIKGVCEKFGSDKIEESKVWWLCPTVKLFNRLILWGDKQFSSDGTLLADKEFVAKNLPGYTAAVAAVHDCADTALTSTWKWGEGYTSVKFIKTRLSAEDQKMVTNLIYRTNPLSVKDILPENKKAGDAWTIDSYQIGGAVFDLGLDFDNVDGAIRCLHRGADLLDEDEAPDEARLLRKEQMTAQVLEVPRDERNRMELVTRSAKYGNVAVSFSPYGKAKIFDEHDKTGRHLYYLRELKMDGDVTSRISKRTSLLKDVEFTGTDLKVHLVYTQVRAK